MMPAAPVLFNVIPDKQRQLRRAGTQGGRRLSKRPWVPAFAGMTTVGFGVCP